MIRRGGSYIIDKDGKAQRVDNISKIDDKKDQKIVTKKKNHEVKK